MLEQRPIVKKSLYGTGAFAFVFAAAMGGTAFMISGGYSGGAERVAADPPAYQITAADAWSNIAPDAAAEPAPRASVTPASLRVAASAPIQAMQAQPQGTTIIDNSTPSSDATLIGASTAAPQADSTSSGDTSPQPKSGA